jgi:ssDNA-binding Zn-finger/Zn-ribbon topoisomerase 1
MIIKAEEYIAMESQELPYTTAWGFTMTEVKVECPDCHKEVSDTKYRFNEFENSLDIIGVGVCDECKCIITSKPTRIYRDNRVSWRNKDGQWVQSKMKYSNPLVRLQKWLQGMFSK